MDPREPLIARLTRIWSESDPNTGDVTRMNLVLLSQDRAIEAYIPLDFYKHISKELFEGRIYEFQHFTVQSCRNRYRTVSNEFFLKFTNGTTIKLYVHPQLPNPTHYFEFLPFESISPTTTGDTRYVDIRGRLEKIDTVNTIQDSGDTQAIHLVNERDIRVKVTLREPIIHFVPLAALAEHSKRSPVVLAFNALQLNNHGALNTVGATRIGYDQTWPVLAHFAASLQGQFPPVNTDAVDEQMKHNTIVNQQPLRVTMAKLLVYNGYSSTDKQFQCIARIAGINNPYTLFCDFCPSCEEKVDMTEQGIHCNCCKKSLHRTISRYNLALGVADNTNTTEFWAFGANAEHIIGKPAHNVRYEQNSGPGVPPPSIKALIGKTMVFTVQFALHEIGVIFKVVRSENLPPSAPFVSAQAPLLLPGGVPTMPLPRTDIPESSEHQHDHGTTRLGQRRRMS